MPKTPFIHPEVPRWAGIGRWVLLTDDINEVQPDNRPNLRIWSGTPGTIVGHTPKGKVLVRFKRKGTLEMDTIRLESDRDDPQYNPDEDEE